MFREDPPRRNRPPVPVHKAACRKITGRSSLPPPLAPRIWAGARFEKDEARLALLAWVLILGASLNKPWGLT